MTNRNEEIGEALFQMQQRVAAANPSQYQEISGECLSLRQQCHAKLNENPGENVNLLHAIEEVHCLKCEMRIKYKVCIGFQKS